MPAEKLPPVEEMIRSNPKVDAELVAAASSPWQNWRRSRGAGFAPANGKRRKAENE